MIHAIPQTTQDPFFFDNEELQKIADSQVLIDGLAYYKDCRVIEIDQDRNALWAKVEDEHTEEPVAVQIDLTDEDRLAFSCECDNDGMVCRHQVAALYVYADQCSDSDSLLTAVDTAIKDRIKRGKSEVRVEPLTGEPWFGTWNASSIKSSTHFSQNYKVSIRSLHRRANYCSCPDFSNNQLGTCKHVEAVLHKIKKHPDFDQFNKQPAPFPYVYLAWDVEKAPQLRIHRSNNLPEELEAFCDEYFDAAGMFRRRVPEDFFRFIDISDDRSDIYIGDDAVEHARHLAAAAAHQVRSAEIGSQIQNGNGRLPGIKARLYPYQREGVAFLAGTGRALLADDMGLGKTLQAISAAAWLRENEGVRKILIICPASLKHQWAREIAKFSDLGSQIIQGSPSARGAQYRQDVSFFIINYELILRDLSIVNEALRPDLIIMDEAQRIKNWRTKIASAVKLIPSRYAFVLTGTPLENRLEDLYSLMQVVDSKVLGPLWRYMVDFHVTDERGKVLGYRNLTTLRKRLEPVMLRRDRRLVRDQLPDRIDQRLDVGMTEVQIEMHNSAKAAAGTLANIARKRPLTPSEQNRLIAALQQARMACNAAGLVDKETEGSPKIDELANLLQELCIESGLKAVVFSGWEMMTRMIEKRLRRMGIGSVRLHGGVPTASRGKIMDQFREDDSVQVFISTDAGGVGLNLQNASVLINMDVPWNPAVLEQRNGRVHRLGQTRKVQIITMVAADSYEVEVLHIVNTKKHLFDNVITEDATEDVVSVSKKLVDSLIDELNKDKPVQDELPMEEVSGTLPLEPGQSKGRDTSYEKALKYCIEELQKAFGSRIERILGVKGGLMTVLDNVDGEAEEIALRLSETIPVALIDFIALKGLNRLGAASPLAEAEIHYEAGQNSPAPSTSHLLSLAKQKLQAARLLFDQELTDSALELLLSALLAAASERAGLDAAISSQNAGVWVYGEAVPKGILNQEDAGLIMRGVSLAQASSVPENLLSVLLRDVEDFILSAENDLIQ